MLQIGSIAFLSAPLLGMLLLLPLLWWILRVSPPAPRLVRFPAIRLLFGLRQDEETPARTPLWLLILRMILAALIILAFAHPLLNPSAGRGGSGPLLIVVDDGWAAARDWRLRREAIEALLDGAARDERPVALLTTAAFPTREAPPPLALQRAEDVRAAIRALEPKPWPVDREAAVRRLDGFTLTEPAAVTWFAEGIDGPGIAALTQRLQRFGRLEVITDPRGETARLLRPPRRDGLALTLVAERAAAIGPESLIIQGTGADGRTLLREELSFGPEATRAEVRRELPSEISNALTAMRIEGEQTAGATFLLDEGWRRRPVGIATAGTVRAGHPLLDDLHYLVRALAPNHDLHQAPLATLLEGQFAAIVVTDTISLSGPEHDRLAEWVQAGGVLIRFAGSNLSDGKDSLLPVDLRLGGRVLGGALSWSQPQRLAPFSANGPFAGLAVPPDVTVSRQILAEPGIELTQKTWASLADGTPLVTGAPEEKGWLVLFHVTGRADWSNLPLSGVFIQMLQRTVALSRGVGGEAEGPLRAVEVLDGFGRLSDPTRPLNALTLADLGRIVPGPDRPPGFYGSGAVGGDIGGGGVRAFNLSPQLPALAPFPRRLPGGANVGTFGTVSAEVDLKPWLLAAAVLLGVTDLLISLAMRGHFSGLARRGGIAVLLIFAVAMSISGTAEAQIAVSEEEALAATLKTHLAYVRTGSPAVDEVSRAGLGGLSRTLAQRTSVEPGQPIEVDVETDELAFFPLLYWPVVAQQPALSPQAQAKLLGYLQNGGTILFDTRDQGSVGGSFDLTASLVTPEGQALREILRGLNLPALIPVPPDHVLTKAFYLLNDFPGRWTGGQVWVEAAANEWNDGVSPVIIGNHDWAGAWAADEAGQPMLPVVPGGDYQREMATRFGVNLVMHVLTGNYKTDQVHVPAILERLGE